MTLVALTAFALFWVDTQKRDRYKVLYDFHIRQAAVCKRVAARDGVDYSKELRVHEELADRYKYAYQHPWFPIPPGE
jgi:hypothetical protein